MKAPTQTGFVEPLEARIAPAVIRIGATGIFEDPSDTEYRETGGPRPSPFDALGFTDTSASSDLISLAVDSALSDNTFFLRLQAGDTVFRLTESSNYKEFITVKTGQVIAFFTDTNRDNEFNDGELTGLSLGANAAVDVNGSVNGDIVTNLDERGSKDRADDTVNLSGLVSPKQGIKSLGVLGGSVFGSVLSGGAILSLTVKTNVDNVLAGAAADGVSFDFFKSAGGEGRVSFTAAPGQIGASISNVVVGSITGKLGAGGAGASAKGGSLTNIQVTGDSDGLELLAGAGGAGDAPSRKLNGGIGGDVTNVFISGFDDKTANSGSGVVVRAGDGGDAEPTGRGAAGGLLKNINVGFGLVGKTPVQSTFILADNVTLSAGDGGDGKTGGVGGAASLIKVRVRTPDVQGNEIDLQAGDGGDSISPGGAAGAGGTLRDIELRNVISTPNGDIFVQAGSGGGGGASSKGAAGGSVVNASLLGFDLQILAGDGSDGTIGGNAGSVTNLTAVRDDLVVPRNVLINAGHGGVGFQTNGGSGGEVRGITIEDGDYQSFLINAGLAGDGGDGIIGKGGKGGGVFGVNVTDRDSNFGVTSTLEGEVVVRSGRGGDGGKGGGVGGLMDKVAVTGDNLNMTALGGNGGDALTLGAGAAGGALSSVQLETLGLVSGRPVVGKLEAGDGGDGFGRGGAGGAGGDVRASSSLKLIGDPSVLAANFVGNGQILAGDGGNGQNTVGAVKGGAAGKGGSIIASGLFAEQGSGEMIAGNAGTDGAKAAAGGSIISLNKSSTGDQIGLRASTSLRALAGNGSHGGQGGDVIGLAYGSTALLLNPTPSGAILIQAGNGSAEGSAAGRGGNIDTVNGAMSSGVGRTTQLVAGTGGGSPTATKSGAGGTIKDITISRGGAVGGVLTLKAGDAGDAPLASAGAAGGNVTNVGVTDISSEAIFRSIAAGDGGDGAKKAGPGGSISGVDVQQHDIGVRTGEKFGYATMGGLFAGVAGAGAKSALNGSVTKITADAISSIVAGRSGAPHLAEIVSDIYVAGTNKTLLLVSNQALVPNGDFKLKFGSDETILLPGGATPAAVQQALNILPSIAALGGVMVSSDGNFGYAVDFTNPGNRAAISGLEVINGLVEETTKGAVGNPIVTTTIDGGSALPVAEVRSGQANLVVVETNSGNAVFGTSEQVSGSATQAEVQLLSLQALTPFPTGQFTLSFGNLVTPLLPATADAAAIQAALNTLSTISSIGGVVVALAPNETARFTISFNQVGARETIIGTRLLPEIQRLDLGQVPDFSNASFTLKFGVQTTATLQDDATAADIQAALNALVTVQALAPGNNGGVQVTDLSGGQFDIRFVNKTTGIGINGEQAPISGIGLLPELQRVSLGTLPTVATATFTLAAGNERTSALPANASALQIQTALNALPSILAAGGVDVSLGANGAVDITYRVAGDRPGLTGDGLQKAQQLIDLNSLSGLSNAELALTLKNALEVLETTKGTALNLLVTETQPGQFTFSGTTVTNGTPTTQEVQRINTAAITGNGAQFTLTFGGQTTAPILVGTINALTVQNRLNALPVIASLGGVVVTGATPSFDIAFSTTGDLPQITGTAAVPEAQRVTLGTLLADPTGEFSLTFNGETTLPLPVNSTFGQVQAALNLLSSIQAEGNVTVTSPSAGVFDIRFQNTGTPADQSAIIALGGGITSHEHQVVNLGSLTAYASGFFQLVFEGETTAPLPVTATAAEITTELNKLPTIQDTRAGKTGLVAVASLGGGRFDIVFNSFGDQTPVTALGAVTVDRYPVVVSQVQAGAQLPVLVSETRSGDATGADVEELVRGGVGVSEVQRVDLAALTGAAVGNFTLRFGVLSTLPIAANATALEVQTALNALPTVQLAGGVTVVAGPGKSFDVTFGQKADQISLTALTRVAETQLVDLGGLTGVGGGEFVLSFGNYTTAPISVAATAAQVEAALDAIPSLQAIGGVSVAAAGAGKFAVTFLQLANIAPLTGFGGGTTGHEVQQIALGSLAGVAGGKFTLTFNGETTTPLPVTATAAEVQAALNALNAVKDSRTDRTGAVVVALTSAPATPPVFSVSFNTFGDQPTLGGRSLSTGDRTFAATELRGGTAGTAVPVVELIPGTSLVKEVQTIDLAAVRTGTGEFQLRFDNNPNDAIPARTTALLPANATPAAIQVALNAIASITAAGTVSVAAGVGDKVDVSFLSFGNQQPISGFGGVHEQQTVALGSLATEANALYRLVFNGEATRALPVTATAADLDAALDALATIKALRPDNTGSVNVVQTVPGVFQVDFNDLGNPSILSGVGTVAIQPTLDIREVVSGGNFGLVVSETLAGQAAGVPTAVLSPGTLSSREVQTVDLANVIGLSSGVFRVAFGANQTAFLSRLTTAADLSSALNGLLSIQNAGGVTVQKGAGDTFEITFVANGDQADLVSATGGVIEVQHLDTGLLQLPGNSQFVLQFGANSTAPLPETASLAAVSNALNLLNSIIAAGGVTVTQGSGGFDVKFTVPANQAPISGTVSLFEQQSLDLQQLPANGDGQFQLQFGGEKTIFLRSDAVAIQVEQALNNLSTIKALAPGNTGSVSVAGVAPGVMNVNFNVPGDQPLISGTTNSVGATIRLSNSPTAAELEAALDSLSFFDVSVVNGALPGTVLINYSQLGDQSLVVATSFIHEEQRVDIYSVGTFTLRFGNDETAPLAPDATGEQIRAALNALPSIIAAGGVSEVALGENSSFTVVFTGQSDVSFLTATQTLKPIPVTTSTDGTVTVREKQNISFSQKGAFVGEETNAFVGFKMANFVGAIYDYNEIDSNVFHFIEQNGLYTEGNGVPGYNVTPPGDIALFNEGDMPIDGIIMARILDQRTINFTPEAKFTATGFFDFNNKI